MHDVMVADGKMWFQGMAEAVVEEMVREMGIVARDIMAENSTSIQLMLFELNIRTSYRVHKK